MGSQYSCSSHLSLVKTDWAWNWLGFDWEKGTSYSLKKGELWNCTKFTLKSRNHDNKTSECVFLTPPSAFRGYTTGRPTIDLPANSRLISDIQHCIQLIEQQLNQDLQYTAKRFASSSALILYKQFLCSTIWKFRLPPNLLMLLRHWLQATKMLHLIWTPLLLCMLLTGKPSSQLLIYSFCPIRTFALQYDKI